MRACKHACSISRNRSPRAATGKVYRRHHGWTQARGGLFPAAAPVARPVGTLKVVTTKMRSGYLRKNGVPYSDKAVVAEYFDRLDQPNGDVYLVVTTVVEDPTYLNQPFLTSSHFKKQTDQAGWNPTPCAAR